MEGIGSDLLRERFDFAAKSAGSYNWLKFAVTLASALEIVLVFDNLVI